MRIYRAQPSERHLLWVVASLLEQARAASDAAAAAAADAAGDDPLAAAFSEEKSSDTPAAPDGAEAAAFVGTDAARLLSLAEGLLKRAADGGTSGVTLATQAGLLTYLRVLQAAGRHGDAADAAAGPLAGACVALESERLRLRGALCAAAGRHADAAAAHRALLDANPDDWLAYVGAADALEAAAEAPAGAAGAEGGALDALASELRARGDALGGARIVGRGPWLAAVERAARRLRTAATAAGGADDVGAAGAALSDAILTHWRSFGDSPSCAPDLAAFAQALRRDAPAAADGLAGALAAAGAGEECAAGADASQGARAAALRRFSAAAALRADCGGLDALPVAGARDAASALAARARADAPAVNAGADPREATPGDAAVLVAAEALALSVLGRASSAGGARLAEGASMMPPAEAALALLEAACILQEGLAASAAASSLRLALVAIYGLLGAGEAACAAWAPLAVRHIQCDAMYHHLMPLLLAGVSPPERAGGALADAVRFFADAARDGGDAALGALRAGAADKAIEFAALHRRLAASHTRAAVAAEAALLAAIAARDAPAAAAAAALAGAEPDVRALRVMRHNADYATQPRFLPPPAHDWHTAVRDWWAASAAAAAGAAAPAHAWGARAAARLEEGGGAAQRARSRAALVRRWAPSAALAVAMRPSGDDTAAELQRIAVRSLTPLLRLRFAHVSAFMLLHRHN
jgi:hypothetical protein